ncbi:hypothetical protein MKX01_020016 [Papaver californicum]|nr:hypothetical protein MKX01_020016 [Papaver californicum]
MNGTKPMAKIIKIQNVEHEIDDKLYTNGFNSIFETGSNSSSCCENEEIDGDNNNSNSSIRRETKKFGFLSFNNKHRGIPATIKEGSYEGLSVTSSLSGELNIYVAYRGFAKYMSQQSHKRREFLQNFLDICSVFRYVKVETLLIESNNAVKAVTDLILILNIKKLVVGTSKSSYRKLKKANGFGDQILKSASDTCDIEIINNGKELIIIAMTTAGEQSHSPASTPRNYSSVIEETKTITVNGQSSSAPSSRHISRPSSRRNSSNNVIADFDLDDLVKGSGSFSSFSCCTSKFSLKR